MTQKVYHYYTMLTAQFGSWFSIGRIILIFLKKLNQGNNVNRSEMNIKQYMAKLLWPLTVHMIRDKANWLFQFGFEIK